jgi:nucleotide-binding universal stress UspA family protein
MRGARRPRHGWPSAEAKLPYRRILVPINGSEDDQRIIQLAGLLADRKNADVTLVFVVEVKQALPIDAALPQAAAEGEDALRRAELFARHKSDPKLQRVTTELLQARNVGAAIVDEAIARESDLIVMASRTRMEFGKVTFGETAPYVIRNAPCEVIVERVKPT